MSYLLKNGLVYYQGNFANKDILISDSKEAFIADKIDEDENEVIDVSGCTILPSLINFTGDNVKENGYLINLNSEITDYQSLSDNPAIGYKCENYDDEVLSNIDNCNGVLISKNINEKITNKECPIHISEISLENISKFKNLKQNGFNISCDINIEQLLENKEYLKYIKDETVEIVQGKFVFERLYTNFVKEKLLTLEEVIKITVDNVSDIFGIFCEIENFKKISLCVYDLLKNNRISKDIYFNGKCLLCIEEGEIIFRDNLI